MTDDGGTTDETVDERPRGAERASAEKLSAGRYRILEQLGKGGMGEVLRAIDVMMNREVAIKRMLTASPTDSQTARFLREARVQGRLDHPAIAPVYELSRDNEGRPFFVMKRITGTTLADMIEEDVDGHALQRLLRAFTDVCNAIHLAHSRGVVHRDLKPSNIMLGEYGEVYVLDWGVAKVAGDRELADVVDGTRPEGTTLTMPGVAIGTRPYMAPEQREGGDIDHRIDVYALGCVLFEILVGRPLHDGAVNTENRPSLRAPDRRIPPELDEIVVAATHVDRARRLPSAGYLGATVQRFIDGDRDHARRRELAEQHLARARQALGSDERIAMKEAGRALALDPTLAPAADIVGRLMLEPPSTSPPEVEAALRMDAVGDSHRHARIGLFSYVSYLCFALMILVANDLTDHRYLWALIAALAANSILAVVGFRWVESKPRAYLTILLNTMIVAISARVFPLMVAPGVAAVIVLAATGNPLMRGRVITPILAGLVAVGAVAPLVAERLGWLSRTYVIAQDGLLITPSVFARGVNPLTLISFYSITIIIVAAVAAFSRAEREQRVRQRLHLLAWRLGQLIEMPA